MASLRVREQFTFLEGQRGVELTCHDFQVAQSDEHMCFRFVLNSSRGSSIAARRPASCGCKLIKGLGFHYCQFLYI